MSYLVTYRSNVPATQVSKPADTLTQAINEGTDLQGRVVITTPRGHLLTLDEARTIAASTDESHGEPAETARTPRAVFQSIIEWAQPDASEVPENHFDRATWYGRRMLMIANAARAQLQLMDAQR